MRKDHQKFFKEICELYDSLLHRCEPYAKAYQNLSLSTKSSEKSLCCRYIEGYYPQAGYSARTKDAINVTAIGSPSYNAMASRFTFLGFDENKSKHQDMITEAVKDLKLELKEMGRTPSCHEKFVEFRSSESAIENPEFYKEAGADFIKKQIELVPFYRKAMNNLVGLDFNKDYYFEFDAGRILGNKYKLCERFFFIVEESEKRNWFELTKWKDSHLEKEEFERMKNLIESYGFSGISVRDHTETDFSTTRNLSIDKLNELAN